MADTIDNSQEIFISLSEVPPERKIPWALVLLTIPLLIIPLINK